MPARRTAFYAFFAQLVVTASVTAQTTLAGTDSIVARADRAQRLEAARIVAERNRKTGYAVQRTRSATKSDTPLRNTPQSVTVVGRALIADQAMQGMGDVVRYVPGIVMGQGEGHRDAPTIRGNSTTADFFVDGVRDDAQYLRDLYNVERVEALKGSNAMVFGRGGGGGVINRVLKGAGWTPVGALSVEGGSFDHRRLVGDAGGPLSDRLSARVTGVTERSASFRDATRMRRSGINPTAAIVLGGGAVLQLGYEHFEDSRTIDRGIPSFQGAPSDAARGAFFGDPALSKGTARVNSASAVLERPTGSTGTLRNVTRAAGYEKFYQNVFAGGPVSANGSVVPLSGYNNAHDRTNLFNQTELAWGASTGSLRHTLLAGVELGHQRTDNVRNTAYFGGVSTSATVPFVNPINSGVVAFRPSATDANNHVRADAASLYAQDQVAITGWLQAVAGARLERFDVHFHDNRNGQELRRTDRFVTPRLGVIVTPGSATSVYASYSVSRLPSSGDQFSSLTATSATLEPERFTNYETGVKWDVRPALAFTAAVYRLDRTNASAPDPADPTRTVQTGAQRTDGAELGVAGNVTAWWSVAGGVALQRAEIRSRTTAAAAGASVPLVPRSTVSL
ncbi:MAG: TonB-dependent receptor, partial [Gemmatimonadaceae bacterium]|nr:TonB-dependent receptor [Gemmatimonadaceae bacterium]